MITGGVQIIGKSYHLKRAISVCIYPEIPTTPEPDMPPVCAELHIRR